MAESAGRFALAYLAFAIAASVPLIPFGMPSASFVFVAYASIAWLPFALALRPPLRASLIACLIAGTVAGSLLALSLAIFEAWLQTSPPDTRPAGDVSFSWLNVVKSLPEALEVFAPSGAIGGFAFWAVYSWLPTRFGAASAPLHEA